jgi:hypothetical protein
MPGQGVLQFFIEMGMAAYQSGGPGARPITLRGLNRCLDYLWVMCKSKVVIRAK